MIAKALEFSCWTGRSKSFWGCRLDIMSERFAPVGILASGCCSPNWILAMGVNFFWSSEGAARHWYERGDAKVDAWATFRFTIQVW